MEITPKLERVALLGAKRKVNMTQSELFAAPTGSRKKDAELGHATVTVDVPLGPANCAPTVDVAKLVVQVE